jgi:hypothetical protein
MKGQRRKQRHGLQAAIDAFSMLRVTSPHLNGSDLVSLRLLLAILWWLVISALLV